MITKPLFDSTTREAFLFILVTRARVILRYATKLKFYLMMDNINKIRSRKNRTLLKTYDVKQSVEGDSL